MGRSRCGGLQIVILFRGVLDEILIKLGELSELINLRRPRRSGMVEHR